MDTMKLTTSFEIDTTNETLEYHIIFSTSSDRALDMIADFKQYHDSLAGKAVMIPHYVSFPCYSCNDDIINSDCFGNGKYCELDYRDLSMDGRTILLGSIRQKCIYNNAMESKGSDADWWDYVTKAHSLCYDDFTEDCSKAVHDRLGLNFTETQECVENSFSNKGTEDEDNSILGEDYLYWEETGYAYVPAVIINCVKYKGDFVSDFLFEAICAGFAKKPDACDVSLDLSLDTPITVAKTPVKFNWFLYIILVIIVFNIILVILCIRRNQGVLKQHVNDAMGSRKYSNFDRGNKA